MNCVDRKFGVSKRFSLTDKREIAALMAVELEMTRCQCKHETELVLRPQRRSMTWNNVERDGTGTGRAGQDRSSATRTGTEVASRVRDAARFHEKPRDAADVTRAWSDDDRWDGDADETDDQLVGRWQYRLAHAQHLPQGVPQTGDSATYGWSFAPVTLINLVYFDEI